MAHRILAELTVVPFGVGTSVSRYVAGCLKVLDDAPRVTYELTSMGTIVLGTLEAVLATARKMHEVPFEMGAMRVVTTIKVDDRRDKEVSLRSKVSSVLEKKSGKRGKNAPAC